MKTVIAGGTGFLGRALADSLARDGHDIVLLTRNGPSTRSGHGRPTPGSRIRSVAWSPTGDAGSWASDIDGADAIVNLAGESIAGRRWTAAQKRRILDSRVNATRSLVAAVIGSSKPPAVFVSGSAVGYYGLLDDRVVSEDAGPGDDFLAGVCVRWEEEAALAADRTRVVAARTGLVLERDGGALPQMLPPFWFGAGGPVGSGRQYWPWIHRDDWVALVRWVIQTPSVTGAINLTAPAPVTNAEFARALGRALHRPAFMPAPAFALKLLLGEMADALLLSGQRAVPAKAMDLGFAFRYPQLDQALAAIFT